jgi:glycosyltransferase involved in cell wall biosynthesis
MSLEVTLVRDYRDERQSSMRLYAEQLEAALAAQGVAVRSVAAPGLLPESMLRLPGLRQLDSYAGRWAALPWALRHEHQLLHIVDHAQAHLLPLVRAAHTVVTCHDVILLLLASGQLHGMKSPRVATHMFRHAIGCLSRADRVVCDSQQTRRDLLSFAALDPARVVVIGPGLNHPFRPDPPGRAAVRAQLGLGDRPLLLHVGQNGFYKNFPAVLRVLARLRQGGLDAALLKVGKAVTPADRALARLLGMEAHLHELGPVSPEGLQAAYSAADVLLFPSRYEGFGWPPFEAMACGTPVVCTRAGALAEGASGAALTAEPEDTDALADHCAAVLTQPAVAASLSRRGRALAATLSWAVTAAAMARLYGEVLEERPCAASQAG